MENNWSLNTLTLKKATKFSLDVQTAQHFAVPNSLLEYEENVVKIQ